jgi:hypothetical protein
MTPAPNAPKAAAPAVAEAAEQAKLWISQVVIAAHRRSPAQTKIAVEALEAFIDLLAAAPQQVAEPVKVYLVATDKTTDDGMHILFERHDRYVPLADCEVLYATAPSQASATGEV